MSNSFAVRTSTSLLERLRNDPADQAAWCDFLESRRRPGAGSGDSVVRKLLGQVEAANDLVQHLDEQFDQEVLAVAQARVRQRVEPDTWEAFRLTTTDGMSGADVAAQL